MLRERLNDALKIALKEKDQAGLSTIRMILAAMKDKDIAARPSGNTTGIGDPEILSLLQNMVKQRRESITLYQQGNRPELADKEQAEIGVIERFLPQQMDQSAAEAAIAAVITQIGATSIKDMGKVMAELKTRYAGQMDFATAGGLVKARLG